MAKSTTRLKNLAKASVSMFPIYRVFSLQLFDNCFVVRSAEGYLDGIFRENGIFNDVIIAFAILSDK